MKTAYATCTSRMNTRLVVPTVKQIICFRELIGRFSEIFCAWREIHLCNADVVLKVLWRLLKKEKRRKQNLLAVLLFLFNNI